MKLPKNAPLLDETSKGRLTESDAKGGPVRVKCPTCGGKAIIRSSRRLSATLSYLYCLCLNHNCALGFVLSLEFSHATSPSALDLPKKLREELPGKSLGEIPGLLAEQG